MTTHTKPRSSEQYATKAALADLAKQVRDLVESGASDTRVSELEHRVDEQAREIARQADQLRALGGG